jgi:sarcosine oxidase
MPRDRTDVVVVGGGVFGLASAVELARRRHRVVVLDRFGSGHPTTSSTGASRSIRIAYSDPFYVNLARDALARWSALERETGRVILHLTGQVDLGPEPVLEALVESVTAAGATIERRTSAELRKLLPELSEGQDGLWQTEAGTVLADVGMAALHMAAVNAGVQILMPERVIAIEPGEPATVRTIQREIEADQVVIAAGPWSGGLLDALGFDLPLAPSVAQVTFLDAPMMVDRPGIAAWPARGDVGVYGHPVPGIGYKLAFDAGAEGWDPDTEEWAPDTAEQERLLGWMRGHLSGAPRQVAYSQCHPWTLTPDSDFIIDRRGSVVLACGCSGHAFKFGPALGPPVADVVEGATPNDLFRLDRPTLSGTASASAPIAR